MPIKSPIDLKIRARVAAVATKKVSIMQAAIMRLLLQFKLAQEIQITSITGVKS
ncbi:MAG: hypothetical protein JW991_03275 [Candidatus Pacebacteria bacterium]|nr:hypothetical protein [Candidatus Paceibacterota bacterium]